MRTFYIALIFIGCLSLAFGSLTDTTPGPYPTRAAGVACATAGANVTGCTQCITNPDAATVATIPVVCNATAIGYYVDATTKQASACPRACTKCSTNGKTCSECVIPEAFTDNTCTACNGGYAFDQTPTDQATNQSAVCISVKEKGEYTCAATFYWNSPANPLRACVTNGTACLANYATDQAGKSTTINGTGCAYCAEKFINVTTQATTAGGLLYWSFACLTPVAVTPRVVQQCTANTATNSCSTCDAANKCSVAAGGFYIVPAARLLRNLESSANAAPGLVAACPSQCSTCSGPNACDTCAGTSVKDDTGFCKCPAGSTPSIPQDLIKKDANITYSCINQLLGQSCLPPYTWNTPYSSVDLAGSCIQISGNCLTDTRTQAQAGKQPELSLTSWWNQQANANRQCWLATNSTCQVGYAPAANSTTNKVNGSLPGNCNFCVNGFNSNNDVANPMCLAASSSSILAMSIAFLGLLLALVF